MTMNEIFPYWTHWVIWAVSLYTVCDTIWYWLVKRWRWQQVVLLALLSLYATGKLLQITVQGPAFMRNWAADIGFVPAFAFFGLPSIRKAVVWAFIGFGGACVWEAFTLSINDTLIETNFPARGDVVDFLIYHAGLALTLFLLFSLGKSYETQDQKSASVAVAPSRPTPKKSVGGQRHKKKTRKRR